MTIRNLTIPYHIRIFHLLDELKKELEKCLEKFNGKQPFFCFDPILFIDERLISLRQDIEKRFNIKLVKIENSYLETAQSVQREALENRSDIIIAVGGGKCIDIAKYSAAQLGLPFIAIPTQAAHDGICSPVAVLEMKGITYSLPARSPEAVLIDLPTIMGSPKRTLCAGIGDLISNVTAVKDWSLAEKRQGERFDDFAALLATAGPESVLSSANKSIESKEFVEKILRGLILSGISMEIAGSSRPCSGSEHQISHSIDQLFPGRKTLHGEQVAFGTLVSSILWDIEPQTMRNFLIEFNLPVKLSDLGLNTDDFFKIIDRAPQTRPGRYTILNEINIRDKIFMDKFEKIGIFE